jgi:hypothetical protein
MSKTRETNLPAKIPRLTHVKKELFSSNPETLTFAAT